LAVNRKIDLFALPWGAISAPHGYERNHKILGVFSTDPSSVNVIYRNEERIHAKGWLRKKYIFMLPDISEKRNLR